MLLTQSEILGFSTSLHQIKNGVTHHTFWYDGPDKKISQIVKLDEVEDFEIDDRMLSARDAEVINFRAERLWVEPSWFRRLYYKWKFKREDKKMVEAVKLVEKTKEK